MEPTWVNLIPAKYIYTVATAMGTVLTFLFGYGCTIVGKTINSDRKALHSTKEILLDIKSNHLAHIQAASEKTNELLQHQIGQADCLIDILKNREV